MSKNKINISNYVTIIGKNTTLKGNLECDGSVRIDGAVKGDIKITGNLFIGDDGSVTGNIEALSVNIDGTVVGNIFAYEYLKMQSKARLDGDIKIKNFIVDEGAVFRGKCEMIEDVQDDPKKKNARNKKERKAGNSAFEENPEQN